MRKYFKLKYYTQYARRLLWGRYKRSYAQQGEDLLIDAAARHLGVAMPTHLDIGANDPIISNNTYLFYARGCRGVCVEPDPQLFSVIKRKRSNDTCLNVGIGPVDDPTARYYVMTTKQLSTFKKDEAERYVATGSYGPQKIEQVLPVPLITINTLMAKYFPKGPDILSVDTEGYDMEILKSLDFAAYAPRILCVETLRYDEKGALQKMNDIREFVASKGYFLFADTFVNSIFIKQ